MSGRHPFSELTKGFSPERRRRVDALKAELRAEMPLHELRDYAEKNSCDAGREYVDEAESGRTADRPQLRKMLDAAS